MGIKPVTVRESSRESATLSDQSLALPGNWDKIIEAGSNVDKTLLPVGTHWVERDVLGISEEVHRVTRGKCRVASCQCGKCVEVGHFPHVVLEVDRFGRTSPVFGFTSFGSHVVQRLREMHVSNNPNKKAMASNARLRKAREQRVAEARQEKLEVIESALRSHKHDWKGPGNMSASARAKLV